MSELRQLTERRRVRVTGTVQGVGFRPFVFRHAVALGLVGFVLNDSSGVLIEVEGEHTDVAELCRLLSEAPPPLARVTSVDWATLPSDGTFDSFRIVDSTADRVPNVAVSVDSATCDDCLSEVDDPHDRRHGYPFTNCTNCGPRYTIVLSVPYDRPATTMAGFKMCAECQAEYEDPADRRFHAQPNACASCGPRIAFYHPTGRLLAEAGAALDAVAEALCAGRIVAIKGIGGYHLACDATNHEAVAELRRRKARDDKPFALMVTDLEMARSMCVLDPDAESALGCVARPIVLARRKPGTAVADGVAPGMPDLGLMLPYTPLHHLLMAKVARPLVMSSGNQSDDPIAHTDEDAFTRLGPMVDGVLAHDRRIHVRCDDSVVRATGRRLQMVRRSRGYVPEALPLPRESTRQVLAVGAELKSTVSVAKESLVVCSHHIGDLEHLATYQAFLQATVHLCRLFGIEPEVVAHDLHPEYLSTKHAARSRSRAVARAASPRTHRLVPGRARAHRHCARDRLRRSRLRHGRDDVGRRVPRRRLQRLRTGRASAARPDAGWASGRSRAMADGSRLDRARRRRRRSRPARRRARSAVEPGPAPGCRWTERSATRSSRPASAGCSTPSPPWSACDHRSPTRARPRSSSRCSRARCLGHRLRSTRPRSWRRRAPTASTCSIRHRSSPRC